MRKTFPFEHPSHEPPRVVASIKNDIRKYIKRERRKTLPEGVDFWDFDCRVGKDSESANVAHIEEVIPGIDTAFEASWEGVYVEILAKPGIRRKKKKS